jgi:hypothetical protein
MAPQRPLLVGLAFLAGCGGEAKEKPVARQLEGSGSQVVPPAAISAPETPSLAPALPAVKTPAAAEVFESEVRDADWAKSTERGIKQRFKNVRGATLRETECRQSRCRLMITGSENEVSQAIADLEGARGLTGFATSVLLTAPERKPDGSLELRAFAVFER